MIFLFFFVMLPLVPALTLRFTFIQIDDGVKHAIKQAKGQLFVVLLGPTMCFFRVKTPQGAVYATIIGFPISQSLFHFPSIIIKTSFYLIAASFSGVAVSCSRPLLFTLAEARQSAWCIHSQTHRVSLV